MFSNTVITLRKKDIKRTSDETINNHKMNFIYFFELSI